MSTTHPIPSATEIVNASSGEQAPEAPEATLRSLAGFVQELACRIDTLWSQHPTDGVMALRLVEASHSLHRAAIALQDDVVIGRRPSRS